LVLTLVASVSMSIAKGRGVVVVEVLLLEWVLGLWLEHEVLLLGVGRIHLRDKTVKLGLSLRHVQALRLRLSLLVV